MGERRRQDYWEKEEHDLSGLRTRVGISSSMHESSERNGVELTVEGKVNPREHASLEDAKVRRVSYTTFGSRARRMEHC